MTSETDSATAPDVQTGYQRLFAAVPYVAVHDGLIVDASPALAAELDVEDPVVVGTSFRLLGARLEDTTYTELLAGEQSLRVRLGPRLNDRPVQLRTLGQDDDGATIVEVRNLAEQYRLEALLRRGDDAHILLSPDVEMLWSMTSNELFAIFPGDNPLEWAGLMDPDDMRTLAEAISRVGANPELALTVQHRLNADRLYAITDRVECAQHDPDLRGVLVRSRLDDKSPVSTTTGPANHAATVVSDHMTIGVVMTSNEGRVLHRNTAAADLTGIKAGDVLTPGGDTLLLLRSNEEDTDVFLGAFAGAATGRRTACTIASPVDPDRWIRFQLSPAAASTIVVLVEDVTDLVEAERAVRQSNRLLEALDHHSEEFVIVFDGDGGQRYISSSIELAGVDLANKSPRDVLSLMHPDDAAQVSELHGRVLAHPSSSESFRVRIIGDETGPAGRWHEGTITNLLHDDDIRGVVCVLRDIHAQVMTTRELEYRATHDHLTTLPDRSSVLRRLQNALDEAGPGQGVTALLFCDVDNFKVINDSLGHAAGDLVLTEFADRLRLAVRPIDTVGRFGGDEFVVVAPNLRSIDDAIDHSERLFSATCGRVTVGETSLQLSVSMGVAIATSDVSDSVELMRRADVAMYQAKRNGRGRVVAYEPSMEVEVSDRLALQEDLSDAIENQTLTLHYQPVIPTGATPGLPLGAEALARWRHPERGLLNAQSFIGAAEASGLIHLLGDELLRVACDHSRTDDPGGSDVLFLNVSPAQLQDDQSADRFMRRLRRGGIDLNRVVVEFAEPGLTTDRDMAWRLQLMRERGIRIFLDDFGTGSSSLSQLRRLPVDGLKIDRAFISPALDEELVSLIVGIADTLGLLTVAEGVETGEQLAGVRRLGVDYAQGFFLGHPAPHPSETP